MNRILIVDDDAIISTQLTKRLTYMGYKIVGQAATGIAAIDMAQHLNPDLILMDIVMPGEPDGVEAAVRIKTELDIPVVFMTGYADDESIRRAKQAEPFGYIVKPLQFEGIKATIEIALNRRELEHQLALLNDIGRQIATELELERVMERATRLVHEQFDYHHVAIFTIDPEQSELVMRARAGNFADFFPLEHRIKLGQGLNGWVAQHGRKLLANDVNVEPRYVNFFPDLVSTQSELSVPIRVAGETVGVLDVQSTQLNAFDQNDIIVLETLVDQIAVAIKNARLYQAVQQELTERKRAEKALKEYSERLEEMVEERTKELREAQERLVRQEKLAVLGQLAGGVSHELRNPLGTISNAVYFLKMILPDTDETVNQYLEKINLQVYKSKKIISDLLNFSRTRLDERVEREEITVSTLVAQVLAEQPPPESIEVSTQIAPDLPPVFVDPQHINQALTNLVTNAYQAMPEGGHLTIRASQETETRREGDKETLPRSQLRLSITDTGSGISPENMEKIFEPLFTTKHRGIGLGLAVSKNLVKVNGGSIEVESEEGQGSVFTVKLPLAKK